MNITVNDKVLEKYQISLEEFLVLYLCYKEVDLEATVQSLIDKGICQRDLFNNLTAVLSNNTKDLVASILIDSDKAVVDKDEEFLAVAERMMDCFPKGRKEGTTYYWRDSKAVIAKKLKTLVAKFDFHFTEEQAIEATKKYVQAFEQDRQYMQLLKYFILKQLPEGEIRSDFMAIIENPDDDITVNDFVKMR